MHEKYSNVQILLQRKHFVALANFYIHMLTYGLVFSFGAFLPIIVDRYKVGEGVTSWIGSISTCLLLLTGPLASFITKKYGYRITTIAGSIISIVGLVATIFSPNLYFLYASIGILLGLGSGLMVTCSVISTTEYFPDRCSVALGIVFIGGSVGLTAFPLVINFLMTNYGWNITFTVFAALFTIGIGCGFIAKPISNGNKSKDGNPFTLAIIRNIDMDMHLIAALLNSMAFYMLLYHITNYATSVGIDKGDATLLISIIGVCGIVARPLSGWLADKPFINVITLFGIYPFLTSTATFAMVYTSSFVPLAIMTIVFGCFTSPYGSLAAPVLQKVVGLENLSTAYGMWMFANGTGALLGVPIAGWVYDITHSYEISFSLAAVMFFCSSVFMLLWPVVQYFCYGSRTHVQKCDVYVIPEHFKTPNVSIIEDICTKL